MPNFRYRNKNTGQVVDLDHRNARFEFLQNWETLINNGQETPEAARYDDEGNDLDPNRLRRSDRGNLLGSSSVGDRVEERHQVPPGTFEPKVEYTEPSKTELRGQGPDVEAYQLEKQPEVITVDPSKQVQPIAGEGKRDLGAVVLEENRNINPAAEPLRSPAEDGVLSRAHPELDEADQSTPEPATTEGGDPDAGHATNPTSFPAHTGDPDEVSTDGESTVTSRVYNDDATPAERPSKSATKGEWVDYAVTNGADRARAEEMTKAELIEVYGD